MPLPGPTDKKKHWQSIVLTPLVTPGTYNNACITVNEYGLVTGISSCPTATFIVVDIPANLPNSGTDGDLAIVLDDSAGGDPSNPEALYVWEDDGVAKPYFNWRRLASTADAVQRLDYRAVQHGIGAFSNIGSVVETTSIVKSVNVEIITPYDPGTRLYVEDSGPTVYMDSLLGDVNPQLAGTYTVDLPGNYTVVGGTQLTVRTTGGPAAGQCYAYVVVTN